MSPTPSQELSRAKPPPHLHRSARRAATAAGTTARPAATLRPGLVYSQSRHLGEGGAEQPAGRSEVPPPAQAPPCRTTTPTVAQGGPGRQRRRCRAPAARGALGAVVPSAALQPGTAVPAAAVVCAAPPALSAIPQGESHGRQPAQAGAFAGSERYRQCGPAGSRPPGPGSVVKQRV